MDLGLELFRTHSVGCRAAWQAATFEVLFNPAFDGLRCFVKLLDCVPMLWMWSENLLSFSRLMVNWGTKDEPCRKRSADWGTLQTDCLNCLGCFVKFLDCVPMSWIWSENLLNFSRLMVNWRAKDEPCRKKSADWGTLQIDCLNCFQLSS